METMQNSEYLPRKQMDASVNHILFLILTMMTKRKVLGVYNCIGHMNYF
jgi:hypothetical protein